MENPTEHGGDIKQCEDVVKYKYNVGQLRDVAKQFNLKISKNDFLKYLLRELATPGNVDGPRLVLGRKISSSIINGKIERYVNDFVLCPVCKKPDTTLTKEDRITMIKCSACGSKNPVHAKI